MELLTAVFSRLLSMALMALPVMAVVVLVRLAMARLRVPRKYSCALWFAVGVRLVCPVSLRGLLSIFDLPGLYDLAEATGSVDGAVSALPPGGRGHGSGFVRSDGLAAARRHGGYGCGDCCRLSLHRGDRPDDRLSGMAAGDPGDAPLGRSGDGAAQTPGGPGGMDRR